MHGLVLSVWLTTLCLNGCLASSYQRSLAQKGGNLTFSCAGYNLSNAMGRGGWRLFTYDSLNFEDAKPTTSTLGITSPTYTLANISENNLYHGYGCDETNDVVFIVFPISKFHYIVISRFIRCVLVV